MDSLVEHRATGSERAASVGRSGYPPLTGANTGAHPAYGRRDPSIYEGLRACSARSAKPLFAGSSPAVASIAAVSRSPRAWQ